MKHLCRSDAVANLHTEGFFPAVIDFCRQSFTSRITKADAGEVMLASVLGIEHGIDHRRHGREDRRPKQINYLEHLFRRRTFSKEGSGSADCEGKKQIGPGGVTEEEFRNGNSQIV